MSVRFRAPTERSLLSPCPFCHYRRHRLLGPFALYASPAEFPTPSLRHQLCLLSIRLCFTSTLGCVQAIHAAGGRRVFMGAAEARLRSRHTGSALPLMLRGKSPCHGVESASGKPQGPSYNICRDAMGRAVMYKLGRIAAAQLCRECSSKSIN